MTFPWQASVRARLNQLERAQDLGITKGLRTKLKKTGQEVIVLQIEHEGLVLGDRYGEKIRGRFNPEAIIAPRKVNSVNPDSS